MAKATGGQKRNGGSTSKRALADIQAEAEERVASLEEMVLSGEKRVKATCHEFSNRVFGKAQAAFEKCESLNQQAEEWLEDGLAQHAKRKATLAGARAAVHQSMERIAATSADLHELQDEAAQVFAELRAKIVAVPPPATTAGGGRQQSSRGGSRARTKHGNHVKFGQAA